MSANQDLVRLDIMLIASAKKAGEKSIASQLIHCIDPNGSSVKHPRAPYLYFSKVRPMQWQDGDLPLSLTFAISSVYPDTCKRPYILQDIIVFPFALDDRTSFDSATETCGRVQCHMPSMQTILVGLKTKNEQDIELLADAKQFAENTATRYVELNPDSQDSLEELKKALIELARTTQPYIEYQEAIVESHKNEGVAFATNG